MDEQNPKEHDEQLRIKIFKDSRQAFMQALESLYIEGNLSGRNHFRGEWTAAADYLFGEDLITYDTDGVKDRDHRAALEQQATDKQNALIALLYDAFEKSSESGALDTDYVSGLINNIGRDVALYVFEDNIVDKFVAPPSPESGFQLAEKKNIVQVDFKTSRPVSYQDLIEKALEEGSEFPPLCAVFNAAASAAGL